MHCDFQLKPLNLEINRVFYNQLLYNMFTDFKPKYLFHKVVNRVLN